MNEYVPEPVEVIVPLLVSPPRKSNEPFPEFVYVPALVNSPVKIFVPKAFASLKVALFWKVDNAVKFPVPKVKLPALVMAPVIEMFPVP